MPFYLPRSLFASFLGLALLAPPARAQQTRYASEFDHPAAAQTTAAINTLSAQSQAVIARLAKLGDERIGNWKYHFGPLSNGESTTLDDSSWGEIRPPARINRTGENWLRKWVEIPTSVAGYDLKGSRVLVSLMVHAYGGDGSTIYINGNYIAQVNHSEPVVGYYKPGERVLLAIKYGRTPTSSGLPNAFMRFEFSTSRPNPADMYAQFVSAALLIPDFSKDVSADRAALNKAIEDVDVSALDADDQNRFDGSLRKAQQDLEPLRPMMRQVTYYLDGDSHIDAAWLWPWTETVDIVKRTFGSALELMDEYPQYIYTQSAMQYNEWIAEKYPEMNAEIKKRIQEGRWEIVGGMWVEPDLNMPDGESQVRQLLVGQRVAEKLYGVTARIGWNPDTFGYDWQLPQIYKKSGIDYFLTQKLSYNETNPLPFKLFWWESPDGSKVLTYFPHAYNNTTLEPVRITNDLVHARPLSPGMMDMMDIFGVGDHGGGPTRETLSQGAHWIHANLVVPNMEFSTAQNYFSTVEKKLDPESPTWNYQAMVHGAAPLPTPPAGQIAIPTWKDELYFEHHRGTYTTQAQHKRHMRESEEWLLNAEKYSALAWLDGQTYPANELNEAWKKALFNQFHDLGAGSGIAEIYVDAEKDYDQVRWATDDATKKALDTIQAHIDTKGGDGHVASGVPVLVFNPLGWQHSGLTEVAVEMPAASDGISILDANNHVLPSEILSSDKATNTFHVLVDVKDVPSVGYEVLHAIPGKRPFASDLKVNGLTLENAFLKVTVDAATGCITSLYNKKDNFESLAAGACGNQLQTFKDTPITDDAWNIDPGTLDPSNMTPINEVDSVKLVEQTPLRAVIRVARSWQSSKFVQDITLYADSDEVDVVNNFDWHETHVLLKTAFPLAVSNKMATYEIPYGAIERPTTRDNHWDAPKFEVPAIHWADLSDAKHGFSLINEAKYGYDCKDNVLRLTLLRSPVSPDPDADRGPEHFSFALYPHDGDWKSALTVRHGYDYNYKLRSMQVRAHAGALPAEHSFISVKGDNVVLTAVKKAEDTNALVVRFYEWAGKDGDVQITMPKGATSATFTNLMEKPEGAALPLADSDRVTVPVHPYSIETVEFAYPHSEPATQAMQ